MPNANSAPQKRAIGFCLNCCFIHDFLLSIA
jgi:hypothetical protein